MTYLVHRDDLAVASASGTSLDTESGALAGLTHASKGGTTQVCTKGLRETDGGSGLALS